MIYEADEYERACIALRDAKHARSLVVAEYRDELARHDEIIAATRGPIDRTRKQWEQMAMAMAENAAELTEHSTPEICHLLATEIAAKHTHDTCHADWEANGPPAKARARSNGLSTSRQPSRFGGPPPKPKKAAQREANAQEDAAAVADAEQLLTDLKAAFKAGS